MAFEMGLRRTVFGCDQHFDNQCEVIDTLDQYLFNDAMHVFFLHPSVYPDGRVCISILHAPGDDPMGYESSAERWSPVQSVEKILLSVVSMLAGA